MHQVRKVGGTSMSTMTCALHDILRFFPNGISIYVAGRVEDGAETLPKSFTRLMRMMCDVIGDYLLKE